MPEAAKAHAKYQRLITAAQTRSAIGCAVAHPCDAVSLQGASEAARLKLIEPLLVGPAERIRRVADRGGFDIGGMEIVASEHSHASAAKAVELVTAGRVEALMKGIGKSFDRRVVAALINYLDNHGGREALAEATTTQEA